MREIASVEVVFEATGNLVDEGAEPSILNVQKRIGGGSYTDPGL